MNTTEIILEIQKLPIQERLLIVEKTIASIREMGDKKQMQLAVNEMKTEYLYDEAFILFTQQEFENIYETR